MQTITTPEGQKVVQTKAEDFKVGDRMLAYGGAIVTDVQPAPEGTASVESVFITTRHAYGTSENLHCAWNTFYKVVS